jgi:hypothetical protein
MESRICVDKSISGYSPYELLKKSTPIGNKRREIRDSFLLRSKLWNNGQILRVNFLNGESEIQRKIKNNAIIWTQYANLALSFSSGTNSEIRVSLQWENDVTSWSYIGTDALEVPKNQPTMNFGWLNNETPEDECSRIVLHEFGHALGLIHEHINPLGGIDWNKERIYYELTSQLHNWNKENVDRNIFERYNSDISNHPNGQDSDPDSIMVFPVPAEFTLHGGAIGYNNITLSEKDKELISNLYPR